MNDKSNLRLPLGKLGPTAGPPGPHPHWDAGGGRPAVSRQQRASSKARWHQAARREVPRVGDSIPDPFLLDVLNGLVSVQHLEDDIAFQVLEGIQTDFLGHSFCRARTRVECHSTTQHPGCGWVSSEHPGATQRLESTSSPISLATHWLVALFFFSFLTASHSLGRSKPQDAVPQLDSGLPEAHATRGPSPLGPAAASDVRLRQKCYRFFWGFARDCYKSGMALSR